MRSGRGATKRGLTIGGGWRSDADLADFEYCSAVGDTPQEALAELIIAREAWLAAARKVGDPIPEPRYRSVIDQAAA